MIIDRLKEITRFQNDIMLTKLDHKRWRKNYNFSKISLCITFLRNINTGVILIEDFDKEQSKLFKKLIDINKRKKSFEND